MTSQLHPRHLKMAKKADSVIPRNPWWIRQKNINNAEYYETRRLNRDHHLTTVCEEAARPDIGECWSKRHATMMIMGEICTRGSSVRNVATERPDALDTFKPGCVSAAVRKLWPRHMAIVSVDRDDLVDGGAEHIAQTIRTVRHQNPGTTVEVLTPEFPGNGNVAEIVFGVTPDVFNRNLETVPHLYPAVKLSARYYTSLRLLGNAKRAKQKILTKSGLMVGLGENLSDVRQVMDDLRTVNVDFLAVDQYVQLTPKHHPIDRFWSPEEFGQLEQIARSKGFLHVSATSLTGSSFQVDEDFAALKQARQRAIAQWA